MRCRFRSRNMTQRRSFIRKMPPSKAMSPSNRPFDHTEHCIPQQTSCRHTLLLSPLSTIAIERIARRAAPRVSLFPLPTHRSPRDPPLPSYSSTCPSRPSVHVSESPISNSSTITSCRSVLASFPESCMLYIVGFRPLERCSSIAVCQRRRER